MKDFPVIEGRLVKLGPFSPNYVNVYHEWMQDDYLVRMIEEDENLTLDYVIRMRSNWESSSNVANFLVFDRATSKPIGDADLREIKFGESAVSGIMIADYKFRNKGYGAEAYRLLLDYGFKTFNLKKVTAYVFNFNQPAIRLHTKVGFREVGRVKDDIIFELARP